MLDLAVAQLWQVMEHDAEVYLSPPPFDHTKLLLVDSAWALVGSANLDPRSLRLNFEINVELYGDALVAELRELADGKIAASRAVTGFPVPPAPHTARGHRGGWAG